MLKIVKKNIPEKVALAPMCGYNVIIVNNKLSKERQDYYIEKMRKEIKNGSY